MNPLIYIPDKTGKYNISATQIERFFKDSIGFYKNVVKNEITFKGNSNTMLGTIVHYCISSFLQGNHDKEMITKNITEYISQMNFEELEEEIDFDVLAKWKDMANEAIKWCSSNLDLYDLQSEKRYIAMLDEEDNIYLNGTLDLLHKGEELIDFKTTSNMTDINSIPTQYITQLYAYCYLLDMNDIPLPRFLSIVYIHQPYLNRISEITGKKLKDYPCRVYKLPIEFDDKTYFLVKEKINLIKNAIKSNNPVLAFRLYGDY